MNQLVGRRASVANMDANGRVPARPTPPHSPAVAIGQKLSISAGGCLVCRGGGCQTTAVGKNGTTFFFLLYFNNILETPRKAYNCEFIIIVENN
jgi:hypothetical protein